MTNSRTSTLKGALLSNVGSDSDFCHLHGSIPPSLRTNLEPARAHSSGVVASSHEVSDALTAGQFPRSVAVKQLEHRSHRLECCQRAWPEQDLDLREAPGAELPEFVGNLLG